MGLAVNEGKTKLLISSKWESIRLGHHCELSSYDFSLAIKCRIILVKISYFSISTQLMTKEIYRRTTIMLYKAMILLVLL